MDCLIERVVGPFSHIAVYIRSIQCVSHVCQDAHGR
jgi:hypothetical protein